MNILPHISPMFAFVKRMNTAFGNPEGNPSNIDWNRLKSQVANIQDEFNETMDDGIGPQDLEKTRDGLCDIMVFALGAFHFMGLDADADMQAVLEGVMTRFCKDQDALDRTKAKYDALGVAYYVEGEFPTVCLKSAKNQPDPKGAGSLPKGKFLKSVDFQDTVFPALPAASA